MTAELEPNPVSGKTFEDYYRQGWTNHGNRNEEIAENDFRQAIDLNPRSVDAYFGLGLVYKAQDRKQLAIAAFQQVVDILEANPLQDRSRSQMLRRLAIGHVNQMKTGDWNLEKEIWKRAE